MARSDCVDAARRRGAAPHAAQQRVGVTRGLPLGDDDRSAEAGDRVRDGIDRISGRRHVLAAGEHGGAAASAQRRERLRVALADPLRRDGRCTGHVGRTAGGQPFTLGVSGAGMSAASPSSYDQGRDPHWPDGTERRCCIPTTPRVSHSDIHVWQLRRRRCVMTYRDENPGCRAAVICRGACLAALAPERGGSGGEHRPGRPRFAPWAVSPLT